jgi:ABC-2 type transport system permease protein
VRTLRVWWLLAGAAHRGQLQYRANFLLNVLGGLSFQLSSLAVIWVVLARFGTLGGWTLPQIAFLYGMRLTAHGLWMVFCQPLSQIDYLIKEGEFDRFLTRPANVLVQVITWRATIMAFGDLLGGVTVLLLAATRVGVDWTVPKIVFVLLAVVGGALVEGSFQLAASALAFRTLSTVFLKIYVDRCSAPPATSRSGFSTRAPGSPSPSCFRWPSWRTCPPRY